MKTQFNPFKNVQTFGFWMLTALFVCLHVVSYATTLNDGTEQLICVKSDVADNGIDGAVIQKNTDNTCHIKYYGDEEAVFVKLFEKKIGHFMSLTQIPIKLINAFKNNNCCEQNSPAEAVEDAWSSNIKLDMNVGFLDNEDAIYPGQYVAVKGHINKLNILLVLVLTA